VFRRVVDVILNRPPSPEDERQRKQREIEATAVKFERTDSRVRRLLESWRRRG